MSSYHLISFDICPFVQRSVIALKEKNVDFKLTYIDLSQPPDWFKSISPMGKVPVLKIDDDAVLFESAVINEYLDETNPPSLHPADPLNRAIHRAWIEFGANLIGRQFGMLTDRSEEGFNRKRETLSGELTHLEQQLGDGPYFAGDRLSLIDCAYAPLFMRFEIMERHHRLGLFDEFPKIARWSKALLAREAVRTSVVEDFETRFCKYMIERNGWFTRFLG